MNILLIQFVDCENDSEEVEGKWSIENNCLLYFETVEGKTVRHIIPLHNILRMTEYGG